MRFMHLLQFLAIVFILSGIVGFIIITLVNYFGLTENLEPLYIIAPIMLAIAIFLKIKLKK